GRRLDPLAGLQYSRYRYYHAQLGRFLNRDPIGYEAGSTNLYEYVGGMPTYYVDPKGLQEELSHECLIHIFVGHCNAGGLAPAVDDWVDSIYDPDAGDWSSGVPACNASAGVLHCYSSGDF